MKSLSIDIETYGSVDLTKSGVYAYANAPDFKILLFAYAFDDEEVKIIAAYQRIGNNGNIVDNFNGGGMTAPIDEKTGIIKFPAMDKKKNIYYEHPMTKTKIVVFKIP